MTFESRYSLSEKFSSVYDLIFYKSKKDPPSEPYKSKYEAKELLLELEESLLDELNKNPSIAETEDRLAVVYNLLGSISHDVEEPQKGDEYSNKAVEIISCNPIHPNRIICFVSSLNVLGYTACKYERIDESLKLLEKAEGAYNSYKERHTETPQEFCMLFGKTDSEEENGLEKCHTQTLFYLAQVYSNKGNRLKAAKYCHTTLGRQLGMEGFDVIDWSLNSATLSQLLIEQNAFKEARNHLAVAQMLLEKRQEEYDQKTEESEEIDAMKESLRRTRADILRCWGKYGICLLHASKERLMTSEGDTVDPVPEAPEDLQGLTFSDVSAINDDMMKEYENQITCDFILTYEDAKPVFLKSQEWLNEAKKYFTLEDLASDHVLIIQDSSQLYNLLAFFQPDEPTQCKLHKRRIDILDKVANSLNPTYYLKVSRELWHELGGTCVLMADLKRSQAEREDNQHLFDKSQQIYSQGIKYFEKYINSFKLQNHNGTILRYPEEFEINIITAYLFLGRMYLKLTSKDKTELLKTQRESLRCYKTVLEYSNVHKEINDSMAEELSACREMAQLIPLRIAKIEQSM